MTDSNVHGSLAPDGPDDMGREIHEGPGAVEATLTAYEGVRSAIRSAHREASRIVLTGTGASMEMVQAAVPAWRAAARAAGDDRALIVREASAVVFGSDGDTLGPGDFVVVASYRGTSPETVAAAKLARRAGCPVAVVTRASPSPLSDQASVVVTVDCGAEERGAATKSELATLAALQAMGGVIATDADARTAIRERLERVTDDWQAAALLEPHLARADQVWLVGFGTAHGIARAGHLLWHEKVRRIATALTPSEFRHGPIEAATPGDIVIIVDAAPSTEAQGGYLAILGSELTELGCPVAWIGPRAQGSDARLAIEGRDAIGSLEALLRVQQLARVAAHARGTYTETFRVLGCVVKPAPALA